MIERQREGGDVLFIFTLKKKSAGEPRGLGIRNFCGGACSCTEDDGGRYEER